MDGSIVKIEFVTSREDVIGYYMNGVGRSVILQWSPIVAMQTIFLSLSALSGLLKGNVLYGIGPLIVFNIIFFALWGPHPLHKVRRGWAELLTERTIKTDYCKLIVGHKQITLTEKEVEVKTEAASVTLRNGRVRVINQTLVIESLPGCPIVIPRTAFESEEQTRVFIDTVQRIGADGERSDIDADVPGQGQISRLE